MIFIGKKRAKDLLDPNSKISSMRYVMLTVLELVVIAVFVMLGIFVYEAAFCDSVSFEGGGFFLGGLATLLLGVAGSKAYQSKNEKENEPS